MYDFLEAASAATIDSSPTDVTTRSNGKAIFVAKGTSDGTIEYTWQVSTDAGDTFTDIEQYDNKGEQSEIMIVGGGVPRFDNHKIFLELYANTDISSMESISLEYYCSEWINSDEVISLMHLLVSTSTCTRVISGQVWKWIRSI